MTTKTKTTTKTEAQVNTFEQLQLGAPCAEPLRVAEAAIAADRAAAEAELFPRDILPATADTIAMYQWLTGRFTLSAYGVCMADFHSRAVPRHPELARLLRSRDVLDDIGAAADRGALPTSGHETQASAGARAAVEARTRYQLDIARQLADMPGHELAAAAGALLAAEDLATRLAAARARHEEHARISAERAEAERREADRAAAAEAERQAVERETSAKLAGLGAAAEDEGRRIIAVAKLRHRLSKTSATGIRVGNSFYAPDNLVLCVDSFSLERCALYQAAIDRAEAEARS